MTHLNVRDIELIQLDDDSMKIGNAPYIAFI